MKVCLLASLLAVAIAPSVALAEFAIDGIQPLLTERGPMGRYAPPEQTGAATFRQSSASDVPRQARYKDAKLLLDLAYSPVTERGSGTAVQVPGFADDIPFASAMSMIVPRGWQVYEDDSFDRKKLPEKVSFNGGKPWTDVLKDMGERYALAFHIDWYDRTIMLKEGRPSPVMQAARIPVIAEPPRASVAANLASPAKHDVTSGSAVPTVTKSFAASTTPAVITAGGSNLPSSTGASQPVVALAVPTPAPVVKPVPQIPTWSVSVTDQTIRQALSKWAKVAHWTFDSEHWTVPVDIPLTASATFRGTFQEAVQQLVSTTELSDTPLQPCFYSNHVVRIVPYNEMCDRMAAR